MRKTGKYARRAAAALALVCALALAGCGGEEKNAPAETPAPVETPAPTETSAPVEAPAADDAALHFTTVDMEGNEWTEACFAGHELTLLNLWAYWCGSCVGEMPDLQRISEEYAARGVQVLGICFEEDEAEDIDAARELGVTYPCLRCTADFGVMDTGFIPTTVFVDGEGRVLGEPIVGSRSYEFWSETIEQYLS